MLAEEVITVERLSKSYRVWSSPLARLRGPFYKSLGKARILPPGLRARLQKKAAACAREFFALRDISFSVRQGESIGIIGRNGSGKSTLLQIITGTLQPTAGEARVRGRVAALLELGSGFNPEFTGRENAKLNAALHGLSPAEIETRLPAILAFADIGDFVEQPVKTYSSGMMLRLAFAVIVHLDADLLVIDEALAVGDVFFVQKCMTFLNRFRQDHVLLFVSHQLDAVTALCSRAIWLDEGRLRQIGEPKPVTEAYLEAFFESDARRKLGEKVTGEKRTPLREEKIRPLVPQDQRLSFLNHTQFRNDLQVFSFDPTSASFGEGGGRILDASLSDPEGNPYTWIVGGEVVALRVTFEATEELTNPILGFYIKNSLGQQLFGDNTFLSTRGRDLTAPKQTRFLASFTFQMPILPPGDYTVAFGLSDGTQSDHIVHHWIHDAIAFRSTSSSLRSGGLVGLPMLDIQLLKLENDVTASEHETELSV